MRVFSMIAATLLVTVFFRDAFATDNCTYSAATARVTCDNADGDMGTNFIVGRSSVTIRTVTACQWDGSNWVFIDSASWLIDQNIQYLKVLGHATAETIRIVESIEDHGSYDYRCKFDSLWTTVDSEIRGGAEDDILTCGGYDCILYGESEEDLLYASDTRATVMYGGSGNDTFYGGTGNDTMYGSTGNDVFWGDDGNDFLDGESGTDTLHGEEGDDELYAGGADAALDKLYGDETADDLGDVCDGEYWYYTFPESLTNSRCYYCDDMNLCLDMT